MIPVPVEVERNSRNVMEWDNRELRFPGARAGNEVYQSLLVRPTPLFLGSMETVGGKCRFSVDKAATQK
jgi:hypothetical protein